MTTFPSPYYGGGQVPNPANVIATVGAPSSKLIELNIGTLAVDHNAQIFYGLASKASGTATWVTLSGGGGGGVSSITGNSGPAQTGAVSLIGSGPIGFVGSGGTITASITPGVSLLATLQGNTGGPLSPSGGDIQISGVFPLAFSGAGSTITGSITEATTTTLGIASFNPANFTVVAGAVSAISSGAFTWVNQASGAVTLAPATAYLTSNGASQVTYTLPPTATQFSLYRVAGFSSGGFLIAQGASQVIEYLGASTTIGAGGHINAIDSRAQITLLCVVANTTFLVIESMGNFAVT